MRKISPTLKISKSILVVGGGANGVEIASEL